MHSYRTCPDCVARRLRALVAGMSRAPVAENQIVPVELGPPQRVPPGRVSHSLLPLHLDTDGGGVSKTQLVEIRELQHKAVHTNDYRLAAELTDLLRVIDRPGGAHRASVISSPLPLYSPIHTA